MMTPAELFQVWLLGWKNIKKVIFGACQLFSGDILTCVTDLTIMQCCIQHFTFGLGEKVTGIFTEESQTVYMVGRDLTVTSRSALG